ncbi:hypothetical protein ASG88_21800 [Nocardioides sp. Soil777]|uniref:DUF5677 domain-containing protein n=1 Tax=Nocardioides sp. Soil777 TaxID=1736409 RepID=UPI0007036AFD|nr:DUF5677 domain-containing protein [Nocardioides sp. Soil777]KRF04078.1 hypothetical protein ASG88_21800 [Nocardioides sp. Soil777]
MTTPIEEHLDAVESACAALDGVEEYGIWEGNASGLLVLHGLAMYARDTARAAVLLLREGRTLSAAALTRVVIEHAVLAQWLKVAPEERGQVFLQQSEVERARWFEVVLDANFDPLNPMIAAFAAREKREGMVPKPKNVDEVFHTPKNLFGDSEYGRQLYLTYRNLSRFVHPSVTTFSRYGYEPPLGRGRQLVPTLQQDQDPEAASFYLASAVVMCAIPYLDLLEDQVQAAVMLRLAAKAAYVPTTLD